MPSHKDDEHHDAAMGTDPFGDDEEVLARTLYSSSGGPLAQPSPSAVSGPPVAPDRSNPSGQHSGPARTAPASVELQQSKKPRATAKKRRRRQNRKPQHYKVLSISLYNDDIAKMDALVRDLKENGFTRMNRSALIRFALDQVDVSKMPHGY